MKNLVTMGLFQKRTKTVSVTDAILITNEMFEMLASQKNHIKHDKTEVTLSYKGIRATYQNTLNRLKAMAKVDPVLHDHRITGEINVIYMDKELKVTLTVLENDASFILATEVSS